MNIQLRDVETADLPLIFEHQRDPIAVAMVAFRSRDRAAFDQHWAKQLGDKTVLARTIVVDGQAAGHVSSFFRNGVREVGYWIDRRLWGRGIASVALREFLKIEPTRPLYAVIAKHNAGSIRVLQKCGFKLTSAPSDGADKTEDSIPLLMMVLK